MRKVNLKINLYDKSPGIPSLKQFDTTEMIIEILSKKQPFLLDDLSVVLLCVRSDGKIVKQTDGISASANILNITLDSRDVTVCGYIQMELLFFDADEKLVSSYIFNANVEPSLLDSGSSDAPDAPSLFGTTDYEKLENKPRINDVELIGNRELAEIGVGTLANSDIRDIFNKFK